MVKITVELVRKKAEHHDMLLAPLQEISLHQESIEKIEYIQNWCPKLQILLLQSNIISKIENLNKLKELEYLNLALNNIEKIENLERCESLNKLDLTLNFIGDISSLENLKDNYNLRMLYLSGNPCTDFTGYREYVMTMLPQLEVLDSVEIKRSDRIIAMQNFCNVNENIIQQQEAYRLKRMAQKKRLEKENEEKLKNYADIDDEERTRRFWSEKSENCPEVRIEMERQTQLKRDAKKPRITKPENKVRALFASDGRPYNINEAKLQFVFKDDNPNQFDLEIIIYKYMDSDLIDVDLQPLYVRVTVKGKIFQISLPEEVNINESTAKRSQTTGHLLITMKKCSNEVYSINETTNTNKQKENNSTNKSENNSRREFLEIGPADKILDLTKMIHSNSHRRDASKLLKKVIQVDFVDNPEVPPLI